MTLDGLFNNVKRKANNYFAPTQNIRTRDIIRELPNAVGKTFNSLSRGNLGQDTSRGLEQFQFFKPTEQVRTRDFVRELPMGVDKTIQGVAQGVARFGISLAELQKTFQTGKASGQFYNTPFGRLNSFQSEAQNRVNRGDPLWKAIGNPVLDTVLAGADIGAIAAPVLASLKNAKRLDAFGDIGKEIRALSADLTMPLGKTMKMTIPPRTEMVSPNIFDNRPGMGTFKIVNGKLKKVDGFRMTRNTQPFNMPEMQVDVPFQFQSKTLNARPGMNIKATNNPIIQEARKYKNADEFVKAQGRAVGDINSHEDIINEFKNLPYVDKIRKVKDGIFVYGKEKGNYSGFKRHETFISSKEPIEYQKQLLDIYKMEASSYYGKKFDTSIKTKSQLTDIWNKTNRSVLNTRGVVKRLPTHTSNKFFQVRNEVDNTIDPIKLLGSPEDFFRLPSSSRNILKPGEQAINLTENARLLNPETSKQAVVEGLQSKFDNFERGLYGSSMSELRGGTKGATKFQQKVRPVVNAFNKKIEQGLSSESGMVRNISRGIRSIFGQAGNTTERIIAKGQMKGKIDTSRNLANDFQKLGDIMLPSKLSREKVWAHLDPELSGVKVGTEHLSPEELKAVDTLREASDLINDQNFAMGKISHEIWLRGRGGKYITRAYEDYDLPPELSEAFQKGNKLDLGGYMKRGDVTDWKQENAIKDPFYLASKRIQSTFTNKALSDYGSWISKQVDKVSDVAKDGYTQLSDSPMWGDLSGKFVRHDVMEDMKGFYSDNKALQGLFDALNAYDRFKPRQIIKRTKTVYNPATRLGNQISNRVFAIFNGINPIAFENNMQTFAKSELANNGKYTRVLRDNGILGTDMTKYELVKNLAKEGKEVGKLGKMDNAVASSYGAADDKAKISAFKYWLGKGKTIDEAIIKVRKGFQDYSAVGQLYDIGSKLPLVGKPFIRFQSELGRIIKNSILENPTRVPMVVGSIALMGAFASKLSGESAEDKKTRENRFGTPVVPFTNIPLVMQTPYGEVNIARMFGMYETSGADTTNKNFIQRISKYSPIDIPTTKEDALKMASNDPLTGGITSLITDTDFRGKSIADPEQSKYKASNLTPGEKNINRAKYLGYNYNLPVLNDALGVIDAAKGEPNQYQQVKTPGQAIAKLSGFKIQKFGAEEAQNQRMKDQQFAQYKKDDIKKNINSIMKDFQAGKIDEATMNARVQNQQKSLAPQGQPIGDIKKIVGANTVQASSGNNKIMPNPTGGFSYTDSNGDFKTAKTESLAIRAVDKMELLDSDKNILKTEGGYWRKGDDGESATFINESKYNSDIITQSLEKAKKDDDINTWLKYAEQKYQSLQKQLQDQNTDELEKETIMNDMEDLYDKYQKYKGYGGFTKPKEGKKIKAPDEIKIDFSSVDIPKPIKMVSTVNKNIDLPNTSKIAIRISPKVKIKKINLKRSISTIPGAKRLA